MATVPRRVNGQKLAPKPTRREFASWLSQVEAKTDHVGARVDQVDKTLELMGRSNQTIWNNQKELTKSTELLDEQFAVSTRMTIMAVNSIITAMGRPDDRITAKDVEKLFKDWAQFRKRPDFRDFMMAWFLGVALDQLPPPPQAKEGDSNGKGDDGNKGAAEGQPQDAGAGQAAAVPEVQKDDGAAAKR